MYKLQKTNNKVLSLNKQIIFPQFHQYPISITIEPNIMISLRKRQLLKISSVVIYPLSTAIYIWLRKLSIVRNSSWEKIVEKCIFLKTNRSNSIWTIKVYRSFTPFLVLRFLYQSHSFCERLFYFVKIIFWPLLNTYFLFFLRLQISVLTFIVLLLLKEMISGVLPYPKSTTLFPIFYHVWLNYHNETLLSQKVSEKWVEHLAQWKSLSQSCLPSHLRSFPNISRICLHRLSSLQVHFHSKASTPPDIPIWVRWRVEDYEKQWPQQLNNFLTTKRARTFGLMHSSVNSKDHKNSLQLAISMLVSDVVVEEMNGRGDFGRKLRVERPQLLFYTILHFIIMLTCQFIELKSSISELLWPESTHETSVSALHNLF